MTEIEKLAARIESLEKERAALFEKRAPIDARLLEISNEVGPLREERDKLRIAASTEPDWKAIVRDLGAGGRDTRAMLNYFDRLLHERFDMSHSGYNSETGEAMPRVMIHRGDAESLRKNIEGIKFFAKLLEPMSTGLVLLSIFEHTLSLAQSWYLEVAPDLSKSYVVDHLDLSAGRYGKVFDTVEDAAKYIQQVHYYE